MRYCSRDGAAVSILWSVVVAVVLAACGGGETAVSGVTDPSITSSAVTASTTPAPATTASPDTLASSTTGVPSADSYVPRCEERSTPMSSPPAADDAAFAHLSTLAAAPSLRISLPAVNAPNEPNATVAAFAQRVPGGVLIVIGPATNDAVLRQDVLAVVNDDGSVRWVRCMEQVIDMPHVLPSVEGPTSALLLTRDFDDLEVEHAQVIDLLDGSTTKVFSDPLSINSVRLGSSVVFLDADSAISMDLHTMVPTVTELPAADPSTVDVMPLQPGAMVGIDGSGRQTWQLDGDLPEREGASNRIVGDVMVIAACTGPADPAVTSCAGPELEGVDLATGVVRWRVPGDHVLGPSGDDRLLVLPMSGVIGAIGPTGEPWRMISAIDGSLVDESQQWPDVATFRTACCTEAFSVHAEADGGVVFAQSREVLSVWLPEAMSGPTIEVSLLG